MMCPARSGCPVYILATYSGGLIDGEEKPQQEQGRT